MVTFPNKARKLLTSVIYPKILYQIIYNYAIVKAVLLTKHKSTAFKLFKITNLLIYSRF